jgi:signal transduction histidine kinase
MLLEQEDLRSSIGVLRKDKVRLQRTSEEAAALCMRLARQWRVHCDFHSDVPDARVPARLHMDLLNMIKECVANAVRHACAREVHISLTGEANQLELVVTNDMSGPPAAKAAAAPWSIRDRVAELGGSVSVATEDGETTVHVTVPVPEEGA